MMKLLKTELAEINFWYREDDKVIGQRIALDKYEKYERAMLLSQITKESIVVDIGANIGYYTLLTAKIVKRVYAFEPDKEAFEILKKNVETNGFKNVILINKAVGDKNEEIYLVKDKENLGNSRIQTPQSGQIGQLPLTGEPVQTVKLDEAIKEKVDLIKIDVQGWEPHVIEGAKKTIKKDSPVLFLEYTPSEYKDEKMINFLKKVYKNIWSINDFAETPWPIWRGIQIKNNHGYVDLWMKNKLSLSDYRTMLKNVKYKKFIKGIMHLWQK